MKLLEKLINIQSELKAPKSQRNNFANYNFRSCEDILEAIKPILSKYGCAVIINDDILMVGERIYIKSTVTVLSENESMSVSSFAREELVKKGCDSSQITGATSSYARKYALNGMFLIDDTKDSDATNKHEEEQTQPNKQQAIVVADNSQVMHQKKVAQAKLNIGFATPKQINTLKPHFPNKKDWETTTQDEVQVMFNKIKK